MPENRSGMIDLEIMQRAHIQSEIAAWAGVKPILPTRSDPNSELFFSSHRIGSLKVALVVAGTIMAAYSILLLVFGVLATGSTRKNVYSGANCILGGRCTAIFVSFTFKIEEGAPPLDRPSLWGISWTAMGTSH